jgi:Na+-translocating ferredoxin:NAD+ oxidoreductase RnfD subunit
MTSTSTTVAEKPKPHIHFRGRDIPVVLPNRRDPRLRLSAIIFTLQFLGQSVLGFKLSIAQILVTILVCGGVELVLTYRSAQMLVWPASGILTGNSISFILRASGTKHGDWWSLRGVQFFVLAAVVSLLAKHLIRPWRGKHLFNPSNVGIVATLLIIGPARVFPQYLWWGRYGSGPVLAAMAVILFGGYWVLKPVRMHAMVTVFLATFGVVVGIYALAGRNFIAIWHQGPISGISYWVDIVCSPELLIFVFFMISDPQTAPKSPRGRMIFGVGTALVAAALLLPQSTEFGIKLSILSSLTFTCALVPFIEGAVARRQARRTPAVEEAVAVTVPGRRRKLTAAVLTPTVVAAVVIALAAPIDTSTLIGNKGVVNIERGLTGSRNPQ